MTAHDSLPLIDLLIGAIVVLSILFKEAFERSGLPALVGFIILGLLLRIFDDAFHIVSPNGHVILEFLGSIGVIFILFRVGLESNLHGLLEKLPRAAPIWLSNVGVSGVMGFWAARYLLDVALIPSLFVATALTATSIAVTTAVWSEGGAIKSTNGEILLDVSELDDISAVTLMAFLLGFVPILSGNGNGTIVGTIVGIGTSLMVKALIFGGFCLLFAKYAERHIAHFITSTAPPYGILFVAGIGIAIAAFAAQLGFSLAIGALFAGLVFSRDPKVVRMETLFEPLLSLFVPFFFVVVGMSIAPESLISAPVLGGALLAAAVLGKVLGAGIPAYFSTGLSGALLIGVSMVPRAEIALVIARQGQALGDWAVTDEVYSALVLIVAVTCAVSPVAVRVLLRRWPQRPE